MSCASAWCLRLIAKRDIHAYAYFPSWHPLATANKPQLTCEPRKQQVRKLMLPGTAPLQTQADMPDPSCLRQPGAPPCCPKPSTPSQTAPSAPPALVQDRIKAVVDERKRLEEPQGSTKRNSVKAAADNEMGDMVEKEAKRLEVTRRRQERELQQLVHFETARKQQQVPLGQSLGPEPWS